MCGLAGVIDYTARMHNVDGMLSEMHSRGPDDRRSVTTEWFTLGFCRLAIRDVSQGKQPVQTQSGEKLTLAFNGEIYNYQSLIRQYNLTARSEAEVLLQLFVQFGLNFVTLLDGDYAITIFNHKQKTTYLIRDPFGIKPLYYLKGAQHKPLLFASHVSAIAKQHPKKLSFDKIALLEKKYLGFFDYERTLFKEVRQVKPGHVLIVTPNTVCSKRLPSQTNTMPCSYDAIVDQFEYAVTSRAEHADVRTLVNSLSGGVDSSLIQAQLQESTAVQYQSLTLYDDTDSKDYLYSKAIHYALGTKGMSIELNHQAILVTLNSLVKVLAGLSANFTPYFLAQYAKQLDPEVKILLCGEGADEIFLGYNLFKNTKQYHKEILNAIKDHPSQLIAESVIFSKLLACNANNIEKTVIEIIQTHQLVTKHLLPFDHATMHFSLETRVPFLTVYLRNLAKDLDRKYLVDGNESKKLLRTLLTEKYKQFPELAQAIVQRSKYPAYYSSKKAMFNIRKLFRFNFLQQPFALDLQKYANNAFDLYWLSQQQKYWL